MPVRQPHRFTQVDVFTETPLCGNPLAVIHDAQDLDDAQMAAVARWTHLSETTFLLPPSAAGAAGGADYRVRIFTPGGEMPFAGHPTLGSCHAWLAAGGQARQAGVVVQECGLGLVPVRRDGDRLAFGAPPCVRFGSAEDPALRQQVAASLRLPAEAIVALQWVDNGPGWLAARLADAATVLAVQPDFAAMGDLKLGIVGPHPAGHPVQFELRAFAPAQGVNEDPVTGSLNASVGQWLIGEGLAPDRYVAAQGMAIGRQGRVHLHRQGATLWVGGSVWTVVSGIVQL